MRKFSKYLILMILMILILTSIMTLAACSKIEFKVQFVVDGEIYHTINTNGDEVVKMPNDPTKEGYNFDGWVWDKDVWKKPFTANLEQCQASGHKL